MSEKTQAASPPDEEKTQPAPRPDGEKVMAAIADALEAQAALVDLQRRNFMSALQDPAADLVRKGKDAAALIRSALDKE